MPDDVHLALLDQVRIASPCTAPWEQMAGDDKTRFCDQCKLHVHNLSAMTRDEAETFVREHIGGDRICARFYQRSDGTIITRDCPVGLAAIRARARRTATRIAAAIAALVSVTSLAHSRGAGRDEYVSAANSTRQLTAIDRVTKWIRPSLKNKPAPPVFANPRCLMGDIEVAR